MKEQLIDSCMAVLVALIAASVVMIVHELSKALAYKCYIHIYNKKYDKMVICPDILKLHRYIDPVGLILAITNYGLFSKQYPFIIKSKKASFLIGIIGYISLGIVLVLAIFGYKTYFSHDITLGKDQMLQYYLIKACKYFLEYVAYFSIMLLMANLYPIATFDISLIIASISPFAYVKIRKFDLFYKLVFLLLVSIGVFFTAGIYLTSKCLGF
ncbi:MAG: hypothetical protein E7262_07000 [Lachnospiraceae bacterium]|nr:hypothetical protein [Lachnospiraceae bacterium]